KPDGPYLPGYDERSSWQHPSTAKISHKIRLRLLTEIKESSSWTVPWKLTMALSPTNGLLCTAVSPTSAWVPFEACDVGRTSALRPEAAAREPALGRAGLMQPANILTRVDVEAMSSI